MSRFNIDSKMRLAFRSSGDVELSRAQKIVSSAFKNAFVFWWHSDILQLRISLGTKVTFRAICVRGECPTSTYSDSAFGRTSFS